MRLVVVLLAVVLGSSAAGAAGARPARPVRVAQAPSAIDQAAAAVGRAEAARAAAIAERTRLQRRYDAELAEIDKLKRQKASWRRDRALRSKLAASLETARALGALADRVARAEAEVARARKAGVVAVDRALATATGPRRAELARQRRAWAPPPAAPRKIVIPDEQLDPLADPEELEQQASALREAEVELAREVERLEQQATRFDRMAELRRQHERAEELAQRDEAEPRRLGTTARHGGGAEASAVDDGAGLGDAPPADPDFGESSGARDFATALSEVVDPSTVDALRRAERSNDPAARAAVARRARDAVNQRLATMRKRRAAIEGRARELRAP